MALPEAEHIKKRWQEYTEELCKKYLHDPDNHDGVITHLEPDILECEVKWALGSITTNKAREYDRIPVELFLILKDGAVKLCTQYISKLENSAVVTGLEKVSFSFHCQRRAMKRNIQTTIQLHSFHMLAKLCSKSFKLGFSST